MGTKQGSRASGGATPAQVREAERGFKLWLRRRFSAAWIAEHASDLMAQANVEYAEWLQENPPAHNPVGWLIVCAERRAKNLLDSQARRPASAPLDEAVQLPDRSTPTPEQEAIEHDRSERLRRALGYLPEKECKLLALVYFHDHSIREAGRKLGWRKSAADRHHNWALEKLRALVGEDRGLLTPAPLGLAAFWVAYGERGRWPGLADATLAPLRQAAATVAEALGWAGRQLGELARRATPIADQASAAASGGGGRIAGACGVAVASVVCGIAASGLGPAGGGVALDRAAPVPAPPAQRQAEPARPAGLPEPELPAWEAPEAEAAAPEPASSEPAPAEPRVRARAARAPQASTEQTIEEFGIEAGSAPAPEPTPEANEPAPSRPQSGSSGSQVAREFGL